MYPDYKHIYTVVFRILWISVIVIGLRDTITPIRIGFWHPGEYKLLYNGLVEGGAWSLRTELDKSLFTGIRLASDTTPGPGSNF